MDYMMARYYSSSLARFMSPDPDGTKDLENPQGWNMYAYVLNNPINRIDPDGRKDTRSAEDKKILEDKDVKGDAQKAWKESHPEHDPGKTQETGFTVTEPTPGDYATTGVTTDKNPTSVKTPEPDAQGNVNGDKAVATVHTHPAAGREVTNPKTGTKQPVKHEQSAADQANAKKTGLTSYVITNQGVFRYNPAADKSPVRVLSGGDFKEYITP